VTTVPVIIRNQRPRKWPMMAMRVCIVGTVTSCVAAILFPIASARGIFMLLMAIPMFGWFAAGFCIAIYSLINRPVDKLLLGDVLEIWPGKKRFAIENIRRVDFISGPEEDFGELDTVADGQAVQIIARGRNFVSRLRLVLNKLDTGRLREWMTEKGISTNGREGERGD
jgi:hypothetical protein